MPETPDTTPSEDAAPLSRRGLIKHATVAGAATVAAGLALNTALAGAAAADARPGGDAEPAGAPERAVPGRSEEPFMVRVLDARTGELDIFHGHRHHRVRDQKLVAELLRAAR